MAIEITEVFAGWQKQGRYIPQLMAGFVLRLMLGRTSVAWASTRATANAAPIVADSAALSSATAMAKPDNENSRRGKW